VDAALANVGKRLRALRRARGQTLEEIGAETGYTASYLSQIETGDATPSLTALAGIAATLGVEITAFFPLEAPSGIRVSRADNPDVLRIASTAQEEYVVLSARGQSASFTALISRYDPGHSVGRYSQFGERFALVLEGEARFSIGEQERVLSRGDCVHYTSHPEDSVDVSSDVPAEILWLVLPAIV
jgi:transcriptional regulator with XRE-family HTH domain